jgi:hypothetical protein
MPKNTDVFDIMIEKEQEAIAFYTKMLEIARFDAFKTTISEFIKMEENHVVIIQGFKEHGFKVPALIKPNQSMRLHLNLSCIRLSKEKMQPSTSTVS